jgi:cytoskeletal protein RodZ
MKTVGEIIRSERQKKELSLERLSQLTKIDIKYLEAIEKSDYGSLPSETFIKGFIRNISLRIDRNPDELIALFRRDYKQKELIVTNQKIPVKKSRAVFEPNKFYPFFVGGVLFLLYLGFQFRAILTPPKLEITLPEPNSISVSPIEVSGTTSVDSTISVGDDVKIRPDELGVFSAKLSLPLGETELVVKATNRFGRSATKKINFTIISK